MQGGHGGVSGISVLEIDLLTHRLSRPHHCQLYFFDLSAKTHFTPLKSHLCHSICLYGREKERKTLSNCVSLLSTSDTSTFELARTITPSFDLSC